MKVYTAVCGAYPIVRDDIQCFTGEAIFQRPLMEAKRCKILSHLFFPNESVTVWLDGNIWLTVEPQEVVDTFLGDADMALVSHPYRADVWQEFATLKVQKRFRIPWLQQQLTEQESAYRFAGLPDDAPLYECNILFRRNNDRVNDLNCRWWSEITRWQWRDQVSLPYVLWKHGEGVKVAVHQLNVREHPMFRYESQYG